MIILYLKKKNEYIIVYIDIVIKKEMKTYLSKRGYVLLKSAFDEEIIKKTKKDLTVQAFVNQDYGEQQKPFPIYLENNKKLYVPKFFGIEHFGNPDESKIDNYEKINLNFAGDLRPHQIEPIDACIKAFNSTGGGILSLPCGEGKTACACYLIAKMAVKTFVLVHKEFLVNQWIERLEQFLPNIKIGKIQGKTIDYENKDIVIGMIQSISMKTYPMNTFDTFGMVILDEAHRCPSKEFSKALQKINCKYMLGLSATPERKDGLTKVLKWCIGDIVFMRKGKSTKNSIVERYIFDCDEDVYCKELLGFYGKINSAGMINQISEYMPRTNFICKKVFECLDEERQILILSDRREMLRDIEKIMIEKQIEVGYYVGGMKREKLDESATKDVILATFAMAQEGLDISTIDTIVLSTPKTEIEQAVGRIRPKHNVEAKNMPLVIDIVDKFSIFERQAQRRYAFYKKKLYFIETFITDGETQKKVGTFDPDDTKSKEKKDKNEKKKGNTPSGFSFTTPL